MKLNNRNQITDLYFYKFPQTFFNAHQVGNEFLVKM